MKDLVITADQLQQLLSFLQDQPHKFSAPIIGFFSQLMTEQDQAAQEKINAYETSLASSKAK